MTDENDGDGKGKKGARGRKDNAGNEAVIKMESLHTRLPHLIGLCIAAKDAATDFAEAKKAVAEATGLHTDVVGKIVAAKVSENFDERHGKVKQLALAFDEVAAAA